MKYKTNFIMGNAAGDILGDIGKVPESVSSVSFTTAETAFLTGKFEAGVRKAFSDFEKEYGIRGTSHDDVVARFDFPFILRGLEKTAFTVIGFPIVINAKTCDAFVGFARDGSVSPLLPSQEEITKWGGGVMRGTKDAAMRSALIDSPKDGNC